MKTKISEETADAGQNSERIPSFTVEIYKMHRIEWAKANGHMLTRRQRHAARVVPESFGALPSLILTDRKSRAAAERDSIGYRDTKKYLIRITGGPR